MHKIIISITSIDSRISHIHLVINSLLNQDFPRDAYEVHLHLSKEPYLIDKGCSEITPNLISLQGKNPDRFFIKFVKNIGPYRKFIPVMDEIYRQPLNQFYNTLIVTADDDTAYPPWWLWQLYESYLKHRCVIGFRGRVMSFQNKMLIPYRKWQKKITENPSMLNVPTGKDGVLYSPLHLYPAVRDIDAAKYYAPKADDLWLKTHTLLARVPSFILNDTLIQEFSSVTEREPEVSLYQTFNKHGGNDDALANIEKYLQQKWGISLWNICNPAQINSACLRQEISRVLGGIS
ncbi:hypothetical protein NEA10_03305 [Phormidium yuhuli AB48]|uniref:Glycosyltransferase 2-like domain-containing protein n=1 Tax=Phormidium yuhuli AB48 TaxID=2940671 RepID=A0ABY5ARB9_9CYAN|nr:hypothetical protein [Phormidium yuhuli]USR91769.1 hypothetical protein NEA10_03305 [Phormidium yuhuli AB48]